MRKRAPEDATRKSTAGTPAAAPWQSCPQMATARNRIHVMHGVNLDQIGRRDPVHYGGMTLLQLEQAIDGYADALGLDARYFQTNHEGEFVEELHRVADLADGVILNAGAWSHYSRAIGDALEFAGIPAVEVHLSDVMAREPWRHVSVLAGGCIATVSGKGVEGYRDALSALRDRLAA
jgi:3-dehydroquinate dehydratase-2